MVPIHEEHPTVPIHRARKHFEELSEKAELARGKLIDALIEGASRGLDSNELTTASGLSRTAVSRHLSRAGVTLNSSVRYNELALTAIVTASADPLPDGRGPITLDSSPHDIALRSLTTWPLEAIRRERVPLRRLIVRMGAETDTPGRIAADWDLDPDEPTRGVAFRPVDVAQHNRRGTVGRRLSMQGESIGTLVTWSRDIRAFKNSNKTVWEPLPVHRNQSSRSL